MKKISTIIILVLVAITSNAQFEGTWKLAPQAGALGVGPGQGDGSWWSNSMTDLDTRACLFDDQFVFNEDGSFQNIQDGETWLETWQGVAAEECGAPVAPHDGSNAATWAWDASTNTLTLDGIGAHLGLTKVINGSELTAPGDAPASIDYEVAFSADNNTMTVDINVGAGWWRFVLARDLPDAAPVVGNWKLAQQAGALAVGPAQGDGSWWSNSMGDLDTRACLFDDEFVINADGSFQNIQDGSTWLETWQGVAAEECGTPVAPHDGSNAATWSYDETAGTLTVDGIGAHLGLAKVYNGGELAAPGDAPASITYEVEMSADNNIMTVDINVGAGWWRFIFQKESVQVDISVEGTWRLAPQAGALAVGPGQGNGSWWSNAASDVTTRDCLFDDQFVFNADGSFQNIQDGSTWVEPWQGVTDEGCSVPVAPHDGSNAATWVWDEMAGTLTLTGTGAHLGLAKAVNGAELTSPTDAPASVTYLISFSADGQTMFADVAINGEGWWRFTLTKSNVVVPPVTYDVTFKVDMNEYTGDLSNGVFLNGSFNSWCGSCNPMDDTDGDLIYELTIPISEGTVEYKFTVDGWTDEEQFGIGADCTVTTDDGMGNIFINRVLEVEADTDLDVVCWNSCEACLIISVDDQIGIDVFEVQPNPAQDVVNVHLEMEQSIDAVISIMDVSGRVLQSERVLADRTDLDVSQLSNGLYFIVVSTDRGTATEKLLIQK